MEPCALDMRVNEHSRGGEESWFNSPILNMEVRELNHSVEEVSALPCLLLCYL